MQAELNVRGSKKAEGFGPSGAANSQSVERKPSNSKDVIIAVALPWLVFFLVVCLFLFTFHDLAPLVWALIGLCLALAILFLLLGMNAQHRVFLAIGLLSFASTIVATTVGLWLNDSYLDRYYKLEDSDFVHVDAETPPPSGESSVFQFGKQAFVDNMRTIGYVAGGEIYCIAPVSAPRAPDATVQYWASGQNCCEQRSNFDCGAARDPAASVAVAAEISEIYQNAIEVAKAVYGIKSSNESRFVDFVGDVQGMKDDLWNDALSVALVASIMDLVMCVIAGFLLYKVLNASKAAPTRMSI